MSCCFLCCVCFVSDRFGWEHCAIPLGYQTFYDFQIIFFIYFKNFQKKYSNKCFHLCCIYPRERLQLSVVYALTFVMLELLVVLPGVIPAGGEVQITVTFTPVQYETSQITIQVVISQFNTKPYLCTVTGSSAPHLMLRYLHQRTLFPGLADPLRHDL